MENELGRLRSHWRRFWPGCDLSAAARDVHSRLDAAVRGWGLDDVVPLTGGVVTLACGATHRGEPVVVKVHPRVAGSEGLRFEGEALLFWADTGAVVGLHDRRDDGFTLLLQRLVPGRRLEESGVGLVDSLGELGRLAARLHAAGPPPVEWDLPRPAPGPTAITAHPVLREALERLGGVDRRGDEALLHGDLHARNVLWHGDAWKAIDPHGQRGDRHAEVQPLLEASTALPTESADDRDLAWGWVETYADAAGLDAGRAAAWTALVARAQACAYDAKVDCERAELVWAAGLHRLADALA